MNALINALNHGGDLWWRYALHAAWQATLLAVVVLIVVRLGRRWPAPLRYWLLVIALVKFAMPPLLHAPVGLFSRVGPQLAPRSSGQPAALVQPETLPVLDLVSSAASQPPIDAIVPEVREDIIEPEVAADLAPPPVVAGEETLPPDETPREPGPVVAVSTGDARAPAQPARLRWQAWLLIGHVLGVVAVAVWTLWQVIALRRTVRRANLVRDGELYERFLGLWRAMSLRRAPRLLVSPEPIAPMVVGVLRPAVVVPAAAETLAGPDLDTMLTHELAHVRRRDTWINWFQIIVVAVWWFNPVIWLLNRAIRKVREDCCDDLVLSRGHSTNDAYCQTLLHAASRLAVTSPVGTRLGFADRLHPLGRRLRRIMDRTLRRAPALSLWGILLIAFLAIVLLPGLGRRGETTEPKTDEQTEQAESIDDASETAEASDDTPELGKLQMELAAQEKALADRFEAAAKLKYTQIDAITVERKRGVVSVTEAGEQVAKLVRDMAEDRLRAVELRLSAAERELSILKLSVPPGGAVPDAVREKTDLIKSLRSQVEEKQHDFADGIAYVVQEREGRIKKLRAEQEAGHLPKREMDIEIANLQLLNAQDKMLVTKLRYLAESDQTYSTKVLGADTRGAVGEPGARPGVDEVLHWETLLLQAKAELIRHEHDWGAENANRKAQEKIIALYRAKLEEARKQAAEAAAESGLSPVGPVEPGSRPELNDALLDAAKEGNLAGVKSLLARGAFVSTRDDENRTPLHWALQNGFEEMAVYLIEHGAEVNVLDNKDFMTPLHWAAYKGYGKVVELLIAGGAKLDAWGTERRGTRPLGAAIQAGHVEIARLLLDRGAPFEPDSPLTRRLLVSVAGTGRIECARLLIEKGADPNAPNESGYTPLLMAARWGKTDMLRFLFESGATLEAAAKAKRDTQPLHAALDNGHVEAAALLLKKGADPNARDNRGRRPLHAVLALHGERDVPAAMKLLIDSGADVNAASSGGDTPLHCAVDKTDPAAVKTLLAAGADPNPPSKSKRTPLQMAVDHNSPELVEMLLKAGADANAGQPLEDAVRNSKIEIIKLLLAHGADPNAIVGPHGGSALCYAAFNDNVELAKLLLAGGADPNARDAGGSSPLYYAVTKGNKELAKLLLDAGADPVKSTRGSEMPLSRAMSAGHEEMAELLLEHAAKSTITKEAATQLLTEAIANGQAEIVKILLEKGADPNMRSPSRGTPLIVAMGSGNKEVTELLLKHGADPTARSPRYPSLLHQAVSRSDAEVFALVLKRAGDPDIRDPSGRTLLHAAVVAKRPEIAKILLDNEADPNARDNDGWTPLHYAAEKGIMPVIAVLVAEGADLNARDQHGNSPLHIAVRQGYQQAVEVLLENKADPDTRNNDGATPLRFAVDGQRVAIAKILLEKKADPNIADKDRRVPLHIAAENGDPVLVKLLVAGRADPNLKDKRGFTPLHYACRLPLVDAVAALIEGGAKLDVRDGEGNAPLHTAIAKRNEALLKLLLKSAADANLRDKGGNTPLHVAVREGNEAMVTLLLESGADVQAKGQSERRPLHDAAVTGDTAIARRLLAAGADVDAAAKGGLTALHDAAKLGFAPMVKLLLEKGAAVDARTGEEYSLATQVMHPSGLMEFTTLRNVTPLLCAAAGGHTDAAALLVKAGADVNAAESERKRTSLHCAAMRGNEDLVRLLLDGGADPRARDSGGKTPLDVAKESRHAGCIALLTAATEGKGPPVRKPDPDDGESKGKTGTRDERVKQMLKDAWSDDSATVAAAAEELAKIAGPEHLYSIGGAGRRQAYTLIWDPGADDTVLQAYEDAAQAVIDKNWEQLNAPPKRWQHPGWTGLLTVGSGFPPVDQLRKLRFNQEELKLIEGGRDSLPVLWERLESLSFDEHLHVYEDIPKEALADRKPQLAGIFMNLWCRYLLTDEEITRFLRTQVTPTLVRRSTYSQTDPVYVGVQLSMGSFGYFLPITNQTSPYAITFTPVVDGRPLEPQVHRGQWGSGMGRYYQVSLADAGLALGQHNVKVQVDVEVYYWIKRRRVSLESEPLEFELANQWPEGEFGPVSTPELDARMQALLQTGLGGNVKLMGGGTDIEYERLTVSSTEPLPVDLAVTLWTEEENEAPKRYYSSVVPAGELVSLKVSPPGREPGTYKFRVSLKPDRDLAVRDARVGTFWGGVYRSGVFEIEVKPLSDTAGKRRWGPEQATGPPDTNRAGDRVTAWASKSEDGQDEWLELEYANAVTPTGVEVYETYNPGALCKVSVFDAEGKEHVVWEGDDPTAPTTDMGVSKIKFATEFETKRVKLYLDSKGVEGWNEIDAVALVGEDGTVHWAVAAAASSTYARGKPSWSPTDAAETESPVDSGGKRRWGPEQATGEPDTERAGDMVTAWASRTADGQDEWLELIYAEAVKPAGLKVHETYNPGALCKVSVFDADDKEHVVWEGEDPTPTTNRMGVSEIEFTTEFETKRVKLYLMSKETLGWNEIDAVGLVDADGNTQWATSALASSTYATGEYVPAQQANGDVPGEAGGGGVDATVTYADDLVAFFKEVDEHYPFFELKGIKDDWEATKKELLGKAKDCKSDSELLGLVVEAIRCLRDAQMWLRDTKAEIPSPPAKFYPGISFLPATEKRVVVMYPPAGHEEALKTGTVVTKIDGKDAREFLDERAQDAWKAGGHFSSPQRARIYEYRIPLRGEQGEEHTITYLADGAEQQLVLTSTVEARGWPHVYNMPETLSRPSRSSAYTKLDSGVGYVYLRRVGQDTADALAEAFEKHPDAAGWIIDLRGNGGGGYDQALINQLKAIPKPVAVLIDAGTVGAGETIARDIIALTGARVFGSRTAGSSTAKRMWAFPSRRATLIISSRSRWRSDGEPIEYNGITPDFEVEAVPDEVAQGLNSAIRRAEEHLTQQLEDNASDENSKPEAELCSR